MTMHCSYTGMIIIVCVFAALYGSFDYSYKWCVCKRGPFLFSRTVFALVPVDQLCKHKWSSQTLYSQTVGALTDPLRMRANGTNNKFYRVDKIFQRGPKYFKKKWTGGGGSKYIITDLPFCDLKRIVLVVVIGVNLQRR